MKMLRSIFLISFLCFYQTVIPMKRATSLANRVIKHTHLPQRFYFYGAHIMSNPILNKKVILLSDMPSKTEIFINANVYGRFHTSYEEQPVEIVKKQQHELVGLLLLLKKFGCSTDLLIQDFFIRDNQLAVVQENDNPATIKVLAQAPDVYLGNNENIEFRQFTHKNYKAVIQEIVSLGMTPLLLNKLAHYYTILADYYGQQKFSLLDVAIVNAIKNSNSSISIIATHGLHTEAVAKRLFQQERFFSDAIITDPDLADEYKESLASYNTNEDSLLLKLNWLSNPAPLINMDVALLTHLFK